MKIFSQLAIVFSICIAGDIISRFLPFTVPPSVMSMLLLFLLLLFRIIKITHINDISNFLLGNMAFFFVPSGVGIIKSLPLISGRLFALIAVCTINTIITFFVTAAVVSFIIKRRKSHE